MNRFSWIARLVLPSVVAGIGIGLEELKETTPDHFDAVLDWSKENVFEELARIYTDMNEDNKGQLKDWYESKRAGFLYVSLNAVVEEGKLLAAERMNIESDAYIIVEHQLSELQKTLLLLQQQVGSKEEVEKVFMASIPERMEQVKRKNS